MDSEEARRDDHGLLAPADSLRPWIDLSVAVLLLASTFRYLSRHGLADLSGPILVCVLALALAYYLRQARGVLQASVVVLLWAALTLLAPSFAWVAAPLAFLVLRVFRFPVAVVTLAAMVLVIVAGWWRVQGEFDPTILIGPAALALLGMLAYRAMAEQMRGTQRLLDDLRATQDDLVSAERDAGVLGERARLSRDLHDSLAQQLSSINLLLQAAEQDWTERPGSARALTRRAAETSRESLGEVRRVVADLAPSGAHEPVRDVVAGLARIAADEPLRVLFASHGEDAAGVPHRIPASVAVALRRTARGSLANVAEHASTDRAWVTLTWQGDEVLLDVRDAGRGFDPGTPRPARPGRGHGIDGMRARIADLGGTLEVESEPGEGTVVAVAVPLPADWDREAR